MGLSLREKYITIITVIAVLLLAADKTIISPMLEKREALSKELADAQNELEQSVSIVKRKASIEEQWNRLLAGGLTNDAQRLESDVLRYLKDKSLECGVSLSSLQPEIKTSKSNMGLMEFSVSASGTMSAVSKFLWFIETSPLPIAVINMQIGSADETASKMNLQVRLSSVYLAGKEKQKGEKNG